MRRTFISLLVFGFVAQVFGAQQPIDAQESVPADRFQAFSNSQTPRISNFSGLPVPRYSSIRNAPANGRTGPSQDYPIRWEYDLKGLPVVVIRETPDWRKVRDPHGDEVWMHRRLLSGDRTVMAMYEGVLRREPSANAEAVARFPSGFVFALESCARGWCEVSTENRRGWALSGQLWGADALPEATR